MMTLRQMEKRLQELDKEIEEARKRLPAHSLKPPVMIELLALADEYDRLMEAIGKLKAKHQVPVTTPWCKLKPCILFPK